MTSSFISLAGFLLYFLALFSGLCYVYRPHIFVGVFKAAPFVVMAVAKLFMGLPFSKGFFEFIQLYLVSSAFLLLCLIIGVLSKKFGWDLDK